MNAGTVIPVIAAPACVIYLVMIRRSMTMMPAGDEEWRQRWRQLDPARRKAVRDCMKRGDPVLDRGDAELSLRAVTQVEYVRKGIGHRTFSTAVLAVVLGQRRRLTDQRSLRRGGAGESDQAAVSARP